jgi:hypothetical protein
LIGGCAASTTTTDVSTDTTSEFYKKYSGTGSKVLNLGNVPNDEWYIIHMTAKGEGNTEVRLFNAKAEQTYSSGGDFCLIGVKSYDGRILVTPDVVKMQIDNARDWTVEVQPLSTAKQLATPGTMEGKSDEVVELTGNPSALSISASPTGDYPSIAVYHLRQDALPDLLGFASDEYQRVAVVSGDGWVTVSAQFYTWKISSEK